MFKRVSQGENFMKLWSDGTDHIINDALHLVALTNDPTDDHVESVRDYFVIDTETATAWLYAKGMTIAHPDHHHRTYDILTDMFDELETGVHSDNDAEAFPRGTLDTLGYTIKIANPDDFTELGLNVTVPRSLDDFNTSKLEGYGINPDNGRPIICFAVSEGAPVPVKYQSPLTHLINYTSKQSHDDPGTKRLGVMDLHNEIIGGWSGSAGAKLISALLDTEAYELAVRTTPPSTISDIEHSMYYEPDTFGELHYENSEYELIDKSTWSDFKNEDGQTMADMWPEATSS